MTTLLRPAAFIAAAVLGLFGLVAAPMSVQAEVMGVEALDGFIIIRLPCPSSAPGCGGWCFTGSCSGTYKNVRHVYILPDGTLYETIDRVLDFCSCK